DLIALQQPVATDLRVVVTSMRMSSDIERMGDLARHVAKVARLRYPASAVPPELRGTFREMGAVAELIVEKTGSVIAARDVDAAREIAREDDAMDRLHRTLFEHVTGADWPHDTETAVDVTLLGRYYERFADHAVSVAERVVWIVTGEWGHEANGGHDDVEEIASPSGS
ncbi:MAG: phosphate signaling complex protein PhoU, partial [Micrococcales bacterium]|nr:phosphate signaling complex protein PhoU [Micrococcales bacterium]